MTLYDANGRPSRNLVVASAVLDDKTINLRDAYYTSQYDFSGTRSFDITIGYAGEFLDPQQINVIDLQAIPGFKPR